MAIVLKEKPIIMIGAERSGTTLVMAMLGCHPRIAVPEVVWYYSRFRPYIYTYGDLNKDENFRTLSALVNGEIDAFSMREPFISKAKKLIGDNAIVFAEPGLYHKTFNLIAPKNFIKDKPQAVNRMLRALVRAEEFTRKYPDQGIKIVSNRLGVNESEINGLWSEITIGVSLNQSLLFSLEDEARWAISNRLTDKTKVPNYLNFIYLDGLETVKPEAVTIIH